VEDDIHNFKSKGGQIIVCTPGRMLDFIEQLKFNLKFKELEVLVLDEADRLLEMGFETSLKDILKHFPKQRRTGLFSATQTQKLKDLLRAGLRNPVKVEVKVRSTSNHGSSQATPSSLQNFYMAFPYEEKLNQLVHILRKFEGLKVIVYFMSRACVDYFYSIFLAMKFLKVPLLRLHGGIVQQRRTELFKKFTEEGSAVLFSTDLASRGLDIPDVDWVIQCDAPKDPKTFVHRIGRTARMGKRGQSIIFLSPGELDYVSVLRVKDVPIKEMKKDEEVEDVITKVKDYLGKHRELYELSKVAYVSYVRAYMEHLCEFVFKFKELDMVGLANGFAMLRLPRMPEMKSRDVSAFQGITLQEEDAIPYTYKRKEGTRLKNLTEFKKKLQEKKETVEKKERIEEEKKRKRETQEDDDANDPKRQKNENEEPLDPLERKREKRRVKNARKKARQQNREDKKREKNQKRKRMFKPNKKYNAKKIFV